MANSTDDRELVKRCIAGEDAAWRELIRRYAGWVQHVVKRTFFHSGVPVDPLRVEEAVSTVFIRLWENDRRLLSRYSPERALATWLRVIAVSTARNLLQAQRTRGASLHEFASQTPQTVSELERALRVERRERLKNALETLSVRDRLILDLHYEQRLSHVEIARFLRISPSSIGSLLTRARRRLQAALGCGDGSSSS